MGAHSASMRSSRYAVLPHQRVLQQPPPAPACRPARPEPALHLAEQHNPHMVCHAQVTDIKLCCARVCGGRLATMQARLHVSKQLHCSRLCTCHGEVQGCLLISHAATQPTLQADICCRHLTSAATLSLDCCCCGGSGCGWGNSGSGFSCFFSCFRLLNLLDMRFSMTAAVHLVMLNSAPRSSPCSAATSCGTVCKAWQGR